MIQSEILNSLSRKLYVRWVHVLGIHVHTIIIILTVFRSRLLLQLVPMHQSCGGMSGDGAQSYAATVISAAKVSYN